MLCQKMVVRPGDVDARGRLMSNTYCMRPAGHEGKCAVERQPEDEKAGKVSK
jgi:hypothetical protein